MRKSLLISLILLINIKKILSEDSEEVLDTDLLAVPNECSSLGANNPLKARDCQVYEFTKKYCCMLTMTLQKDDEDDIVKTACIKLNSISNSAKSKRLKEYKDSFSGYDILIECYSSFLRNNFIITFISFLLLF